MTDRYDVVVVGSGSAGLIAAIAAREKGARVLILEKAPFPDRGGNGRYTGGAYRFFHTGTDEVLRLMDDLPEAERQNIRVIEYSRSQFQDDLFRITENKADPEIATMIVDQSAGLVNWLAALGLKWEPCSAGSMRIGDLLYLGVPTRARAPIAARGGGEGLIDQLSGIAERRGVDFRYETKAVKLLTDDAGRVVGVKAKGKNGFVSIECEAVVLACGGFEANPEMRTKYLGPEWDEVRVRGTRYDTGDGLKMAEELGAEIGGNLSGCHCSCQAGEIPWFGGGGERNCRYSYPFGITVNVNGERFFDEGQDERSNTYAKFGRAILRQPMRTAFQVFDAEGLKLLQPAYQSSRPAVANSIEELGEMITLAPEKLVETVRQFNEAVQPGNFDPLKLDGKGTRGIEPPKSNWAMEIKAPPFHAYTVVPAITFTFGGVKTDSGGRVLDTEGSPVPGLYACGEVMSEPFHMNYAGGAGLTAGGVTGRIAGTNAAKSVTPPT